MTFNIHASCVTVKNKGILLLGDSGSGKSDLTLRLIEQCNAKLVADDRVDLSIKNNQIIASCPKNIHGLLEVRGIGIVKYPYIKEATIDLVVFLSDEIPERLPDKGFYNIENIKIPLIRLNSGEISAPFKVMAALRLL